MLNAVEQVAQRAYPVLHVAAHVLGLVELRLLLEQPDGRRRVQLGDARGRLLAAGHDAQQRRLAGTVRAEHADLRPVQERERDVGQHLALRPVELVGPVHRVDHVAAHPEEATGREAAGSRLPISITVDMFAGVKGLPLVDCCTPLAGSSLTDADAVELERLFKALADKHRLKIINILLRSGDEAVCVCEFQPALGVSQPTVSHHLKQLLDAGLLDREKRGSFAYFRLDSRSAREDQRPPGRAAGAASGLTSCSTRRSHVRSLPS